MAIQVLDERDGSFQEISSSLNDLYSTVGNVKLEANTKEYWNSQPTLVSTLNKLYIYTNYSQENGHDVPAFKVGDGLAYLIDLPFSYMGNIPAEQIEFWNNKVTAYLDTIQAETLVLTKN